MGCRKEIDYYKSKKSRKKQKSSGKSRRVQAKTTESGQKQKSPSKNNRIRAKQRASISFAYFLLITQTKRKTSAAIPVRPEAYSNR